MWDKIKERVANLFELLTSKKALIAIAACSVFILVTSVPKIIAVGSVAVAYILAQGYVDAQKERSKAKQPKQPKK